MEWQGCISQKLTVGNRPVLSSMNNSGLQAGPVSIQSFSFPCIVLIRLIIRLNVEVWGTGFDQSRHICVLVAEWVRDMICVNILTSLHYLGLTRIME